MITARLQLLRQSTLFMNAFYLMLSTFTVAAVGLVFWILVTKTYDATAVGLATTLLSVSGLLSLLGLAGFDTTFVRFLPTSERKNDYIHTGLIVVASCSALLAASLAAILPHISANFAMLTSPQAFVAFVAFTVITSLNVLANSIFLAFKQARYIFVINALFSTSKIVFILLFAQGSAMTIFIIAGLAQLLGLLLNLFFLKRELNYRFAPILHINTLKIVRKFSFSMYVSSVLNLLPPTILPLIIVYHLNPKYAAYYYMAFTIASALYTIAYASMQSVFAEGSHNESAMRSLVSKAALLITVLLVPAAIITALISNILLAMFNSEYAANASGLLQLFALGALPVAVYSALGAIFKVKKNLHAMVVVNVVYAICIVGLSYLFLPSFGLQTVGWAWLIGNIAACCTGAFFLRTSLYNVQIKSRGRTFLARDDVTT